MTERERLIELLESAESAVYWNGSDKGFIQKIADHLIANGVTIPVRCKDCRYYNDDGEYCGMWGEVRHPEHFCDEGARK